MKIKTYTIDLSEQMAVCDANYIRLLKLLGNTRSMNHRVFALPYLGQGQTKEQISVSLEVLEEFKYTSTISMRQRRLFRAEDKVERKSGKSEHYNSLEMIVRVYHDAKTAEVTSYQNHKYFKAVYPVPNPLMYQCDEKEQLNLFLAEWLNLCINEGLSNLDKMQLDKLTCS